MFGAVDEGVRAYGVASHRHRPEIEMGIALAAQRDAAVTFTPHLVPMQLGILATSTARATDGVTGGDLSAALSDFYENEPFVDVMTTRSKALLEHRKNTVFAAPTDYTKSSLPR